MINWLSKWLPNVVSMGWGGDYGWWQSIYQTLYMTFFSAIIGGLIGLFFAVVLVISDTDGILPNKSIFWLADKIVSIFRAVPFIILLFVISPLTQVLIGTTLGATAALVPLSLSVAPFYARQIQAVLKSIDPGEIEAAESFGATNWDILIIYMKESFPEIIRVSTVTLISLVGLTAMAGAIGSGGLGNTVVTFGQQSKYDVVWVGTIALLLLIFLIQGIGDWLANKSNHAAAQ
ncbi:ABC transporter permease [Oenococcus sicerae]|uniref:ABC transporter permease n=1 Tax=Oenococcus sicerae TaxID=2203724 RepID=A0AAJ1RCV4_9LACO|nr:methionine ABC transporter permease [Oenococcus sicerae]MDN6900417.1 ABC transporter permease [Oenococcus sicerae]QAS69563.1 ABC transporter permease [Oenococcus sicerae]